MEAAASNLHPSWVIVLAEQATRKETIVPLFSCDQWKQLGSHAIFFCTAEKVLDVTSLVIFFLVFYQCYVYIFSYKILLKDLRVGILLVSLLASFNMFWHYAILWGPIRSKTFFLVEIFRFFLFFALSYYYVHKASGLLDNRRIIICVLRSMFLIGVVLIIVIGILFMIDIDAFIDSNGKEGLNPANLCMEVTFQIYRYFPYVIQLILLVSYFNIKKTVQQSQQQSLIDKTIYQLQMRTLNKLIKVLIMFFSTNVFLNLYDIASEIKASNDADP